VPSDLVKKQSPDDWKRVSYNHRTQWTLYIINRNRKDVFCGCDFMLFEVHLKFMTISNVLLSSTNYNAIFRNQKYTKVIEI
jgi:hypothetical protein